MVPTPFGKSFQILLFEKPLDLLLISNLDLGFIVVKILLIGSQFMSAFRWQASVDSSPFREFRNLTLGLISAT